MLKLIVIKHIKNENNNSNWLTKKEYYYENYIYNISDCVRFYGIKINIKE